MRRTVVSYSPPSQSTTSDHARPQSEAVYAPPAGPRPKLPTGFVSGGACANYDRLLAVWREQVIRRAAFERAVGSRAALFCDVREAFRVRPERRRNVA